MEQTSARLVPGWQRGYAADCRSADPGSNPGPGLPTAIETGETPGPIPNPEVKPGLVPRCTVFREGTGSAEAVGTLPSLFFYNFSVLQNL